MVATESNIIGRPFFLPRDVSKTSDQWVPVSENYVCHTTTIDTVT